MEVVAFVLVELIKGIMIVLASTLLQVPVFTASFWYGLVFGLSPLFLYCAHRLGRLESIVGVEDLTKVFELFKSSALLLLAIEAGDFFVVCLRDPLLDGCVEESEYSSISFIASPDSDRVRNYYLGRCTPDQLDLASEQCSSVASGFFFGLLVISEMATTIFGYGVASDIESGHRVEQHRIELMVVCRVMSVAWLSVLFLYEPHRAPAVNYNVIMFVSSAYTVLQLLFLSQVILGESTGKVGASNNESESEPQWIWYVLSYGGKKHRAHRVKSLPDIALLVEAVRELEALDAPPRQIKVLAPGAGLSPLEDAVPQHLGLDAGTAVQIEVAG